MSIDAFSLSAPPWPGAQLTWMVHLGAHYSFLGLANVGCRVPTLVSHWGLNYSPCTCSDGIVAVSLVPLIDKGETLSRSFPPLWPFPGWVGAVFGMRGVLLPTLGLPRGGT